MDPSAMPSVIIRNMKRSPHFIRASPEDSVGESIELQPNEIIIGMYQNQAPWVGYQVIFTNLAMHVVEESDSFRVSWSDIVDYETLDPRTHPDGVRLRTRDGIRFIRIGGSYGPAGKFRDAFNLAMILRALLGR